jgi:hypothetical protein
MHRVTLRRAEGTEPEWQWWYRHRRGDVTERDLIVESRELELPTGLSGVTKPDLVDLVGRYDLRHARWLGQYLLRRLLDGRLSEHTAGREVYDFRRRRWAAKLMPKNLLGALWLQIACAVEGESQGWRPCKRAGCPHWIGPDRNQRREFCSTKCRVLEHYHAQKRRQSAQVPRQRASR